MLAVTSALAARLGHRARRKVGVAAALAVMVLTSAAAAQAPAQVSADDPYTATVTVDATADGVPKARDAARIDGQRRALTAIVERLAGGADKAKPLKLGDNAVTNLVASFEVANERMTAVRYIADYTFHFRKPDLDKVLQAAGIPLAGAGSGPGGAPPDANAPPATGGKPTVLLPLFDSGGVSLLWDDPNPWRDAWGTVPDAKTGPRVLVPVGDVSDVDAIDADRARAGDAGALNAIAGKYGADEVIVAIAVPRTAGGKQDGIDITARRYRRGQFVDAHAESVDADAGSGGEGALFRRAAEKVAADIATGWKDAKPPANEERATLTAVLPISGLDDWLKVRDRLGLLPPVRKVEVKSLSRQEATLEIQYVGAIDRLKSSLAGINLDLVGGDPVWQLARTSANR
jgi:hypothetical protein